MTVEAQLEPTAHELTDPLVGTWIAGRFRVQRLLAEGGMGRVYLAHQVALDRSVAIKVLHVRDPAQQVQFQRRFELEAGVLGRLKHPNTVRVFDYGLHEGQPFIAMEYIDGPTLADEMAGPMEPLDAVRLVRQLAAALDEAHEYGVVHRDLKPMNVLLARTRQGVVAKVLDFGVASLANTDDRGPGGTVLGTAAYMAPEQVQGRPVDHRADLYALGVILYGLLTGARPYDVDSTRQMLRAHLTSEPVSFAARGARLPRVLEWTVHACLRKQVDERIASARELVAALNHCELALRSSRFDVLPRLEQGKVVLPQVVAARDGGFQGPEIPAERSNHRLSLFTALAAAVVVAMLIGLYAGRSRPEPIQAPRSEPIPSASVSDGVLTPGRTEVQTSQEPRSTGPAAAPRVSPRRSLHLGASDLLDPFADRR